MSRSGSETKVSFNIHKPRESMNLTVEEEASPTHSGLCFQIGWQWASPDSSNWQDGKHGSVLIGGRMEERERVNNRVKTWHSDKSIDSSL